MATGTKARHIGLLLHLSVQSWSKNSSFFERILGSLISSHILLTDPKHPFGKVGFEGYDNELLRLAHDLAVRLLPAFENTHTGIPYPRVSRSKDKTS